ncbi:MAG: RsmD family RNA methyltransferase [Planctomycetota bacterium]
MSLKVLGGRLRGRKLASLAGQATRPLLGQVKQALCNILGERVHDAVVWDLFAGTGATGIELLSRGAARVCFVERAPEALRCLQANLDALGLAAQATVLRADAWDPPRLPHDWSPASLVFVDPPYAIVQADPRGCLERLAALLDAMDPLGRLLFHFARGAVPEAGLEGLGALDLRHWGGASVAILAPPRSAA